MKLYSKHDKTISIWLSFMCFAVISMIFIGGLTRLTNSGLSMTEWKPITGLLPPMSINGWQNEFAKYQQSPEYQKINIGMTVEEFKSIYWLEYIHRMAGRATALIFLLPLIFFIIAGNIRGFAILKYIAIGLLISGQGILGWYMVKSGLVNQPHVSHLRLAMHLILATIIYSLLFWQKMKSSFDILLIPGSSPNLIYGKISKSQAGNFFAGIDISSTEGASRPSPSKQRLNNVLPIFYSAIALVFLQIFVGGMVAGLNAGLVYNTYPLMGDYFIPSEIFELNFSFAIWHDPVFIQFCHRILAKTIFVVVAFLVYKCIKLEYKKLQEAASFMMFAVTLQMVLGVLTLIYVVPLSYALAHQLGAIFLLSCLLWGLFLIKNS